MAQTELAAAKVEWDVQQTSIIAMADRQRVVALEALEARHREALDRTMRQVRVWHAL